MPQKPNQKYTQFPIRLNRTLSDALDAVAAQSHIPKTTISRMALERFIVRMDDHGALELMDRVMES